MSDVELRLEGHIVSRPSSSADDLRSEFEAALREHGLLTGGLMVGDIIRFSGYAVRITGCDGGRIAFEQTTATDR